VSALAFVLGAGFAVSVAVTARVLRGHDDTHVHARPIALSMPADLPARLALGAAGALCFGILTRWPVAALGGASLGFFSKELLSPKSQRNAPIERTEAIAVWAEQLRDTMAAAAGLQQAIVATASLSPAPIRKELQALALRAEREPLTPLLLGLAQQLADPTADLVITALVLAASGEAQDLSEVLSQIAASARDDATMRRHVDASRARTRTAVRTITAIALLTLIGLLVVGHGYLKPYSSAIGQVVLAIVLACYGTGVWILQRMAKEAPPARLLSQLSRSARP
jgi:tight adherence protein B